MPMGFFSIDSDLILSSPWLYARTAPWCCGTKYTPAVIVVVVVVMVVMDRKTVLPLLCENGCIFLLIWEFQLHVALKDLLSNEFGD